MRWFGRAYGAAYEEDSEPVPVPVGLACKRCAEVFTAESSGFLMPFCEVDGAMTQIGLHYECHMRQVIGGLNHLKGSCTCCGGTDTPDPPDMTKRQAAQAAVRYWNTQRIEALKKRIG